MNSLETPWDFQRKKVLDGYDIEYQDLTEISQGGPVVGTLFINGTIIGSSKFGGPLLFKSPHIYVPVLSQNLFGVSFKLCKIELSSMIVLVIGINRDLIFLSHIDDYYVYFYSDADKKNILSERIIS